MARAKGDIDPGRVDVRAKPKRRRKRNRPDPHPALKAGEAKAIARAEKRAPTPAIMLEPDGDGWVYTPPHNDPALFEAQVADCFGTRSLAVMRTFLEDLRRLCAKDYDPDLQRWKNSETELSAAMAMVADIQPRNTSEAALAAQMVAVHWMQMRLSRDALNNGGMILEKQAALASKLARTYAIQLATLREIRGGKKPVRQSIKVTRDSHHHQHIHVHRGEGGTEIDGQPCEPGGGEAPRITDQREALRGEEPGGEVVPLSRAAGKK